MDYRVQNMWNISDELRKIWKSWANFKYFKVSRVCNENIERGMYKGGLAAKNRKRVI
jgi:hypothetical protein